MLRVPECAKISSTIYIVSLFEFLEYVGVVDSLRKMCHRINHPRFAHLKSFTKSNPQEAGKGQLSSRYYKINCPSFKIQSLQNHMHFVDMAQRNYKINLPEVSNKIQNLNHSTWVGKN